MNATRWMLCAVVSFLLVVPAAARSSKTWTGVWVTDRGALRIEQDRSAVTGTYGKGGAIEAKVSGTRLKGSYEEDGLQGTIAWELDATGRHFKGTWRRGGDSGTWRGWRQHEDGESKAAAGKFTGHWATSIGTLRLEQKGSSVSGPWRHQGWSSIKGTVKGRRLTGTLKTPRWQGEVWLELTDDGNRLFGLSDERPPAAVRGVRVEDFSESPKLKAGEIAQGIAENGMLYFIRPPTGWRKGKAVDAIVLLHGSNWTTKGMVWVTAKNWPSIAKNYMLIGIQGDLWSEFSDPPDLRFNYHYVNWMGKSTYKGFPYTHKDSPFLVSEVVEHLGEAHKWKRVFIGGHSQGGFMTLLMYTHYPELFAGAFPIAGGMVMQAEPNVFDDEDLKAAQRATPLCIVHGSKDTVVPHTTGLYVRDRFEGSGFPLMHLIDPPLGHPYDFLPIGDAIDYLDALSTTDTKVLAEYADVAAKNRQWRVVSAALTRANQIKAGKKLAAAAKKLDAKAAKGAKKFLERLKKGEGGKWVDDFVTWKRDFYGAPSAEPVMALYEKLRDEHDGPAEALLKEARTARHNRDESTVRAKYQEVVDSYWASGRYPLVRRWLEEMK